MYQKQIEEAQALEPHIIERLGRSLGVPTREILAQLTDALELSQIENGHAFAACQLGVIAGRAVARDLLSFDAAAAMLKCVTGLLSSMPEADFRAWFNNRDESDFAIQKDFISFCRKYANEFPTDTCAVLGEFKAVVESRCGLPGFDIVNDVLSNRPLTNLGTLCYVP